MSEDFNLTAHELLAEAEADISKADTIRVVAAIAHALLAIREELEMIRQRMPRQNDR